MDVKLNHSRVSLDEPKLDYGKRYAEVFRSSVEHQWIGPLRTSPEKDAYLVDPPNTVCPTSRFVGVKLFRSAEGAKLKASMQGVLALSQLSPSSSLLYIGYRGIKLSCRS